MAADNKPEEDSSEMLFRNTVIKKWVIAAAASALLGLGLAACGGDDDDDDTKVGGRADANSGVASDRVTFDSTDKAFRETLKLAAAENKDLKDSGGRAAIIAFDFEAHDRKGAEVKRFDKPITITIRYGGVAGQYSDAELTMVFWNVSGAWEDVPSTVDATAKTVSASVDHFSKYGVSTKATGGKGTTTNSSGTPTGAGVGGASQSTVTKDGTPVGGGQSAGGAGVKYDVTTALNVFNQAVFGRTFTFTDAGAAAAGVIASATFPQNDKGILTAKVATAGVAAYGKMSNGAEIVLAGVSGAVTNDAAADIVAGGIGEVAMGGFTKPADQAAALELVKQVAPKLAGLRWTVTQSTGGTWVFSASGFIQVQTEKGNSRTDVGALATVSPSSDGKAIVAVGVGTGSQAKVY